MHVFGGGLLKKVLVIVDMQEDFISGSLGSEFAKAIVPSVVSKIEQYKALNKVGKASIVCTLDTHEPTYLETQEGKILPVVHCVKGTEGWKLNKEVDEALEGLYTSYEKMAFGSIMLANELKTMHESDQIEEIEIVGLVSSICVISNALILKAALPEVKITVDAKCIAGVSESDNTAALTVMKMCHINVINEGKEQANE